MNPTPNRAGFDPSGIGSNLSVRRAIAVGGQVVRVVFSSEPKHRSSSAFDDGRNPANYGLSVTAGEGQPLQVVGVKPDVVPGPAYGVAAGEFALDIQTDRDMVVGLQYLVTVKPALIAADGTPIGDPYSAAYIGAARPSRTRQNRRKIGLVDLASDPFVDGITVDAAGDWASHEGLPGTQKRVWRIAFTGKGKFLFMQNFGLNYDIKKPATLSILQGLRTDLKQQIQQQPDVKASSTSVSMDARGFLSLTIAGQTASGEPFSDTMQASEGGIQT